MLLHLQRPSTNLQRPLPPRVWTALAGGADWLSSWWPPVVLAILFFLTVLVLILRRRNRTRAWPLAPVALVFLLCCGVAVANTISGYVPSVAAAQVLMDGVKERVSLRRGAMLDLQLPVKKEWHLNVTDTYVYLPPGYEKDKHKRYPVVYLIHGEPGTSADWLAAGSIELTLNTLIRGGYIKPMIAVFPDMRSQQHLDTECLNSTRPGGGQVATYLNYVVHYVDTHYRTKANWRNRSVGGFSMGGYCALDRGLRTTEFGSLLSIMPYDNPGLGGQAALSSKAEYDAATPRLYIPTMKFHHPVACFIAVGSDSSPQTALRMETMLRARHQKVQLQILDGQAHTWDMARLAAVYALRFASDQMPG